MGLEAVKEEVIRQAKEQESVMIAEARRESNKQAKEAEKKTEEMKEKTDLETKKMIDTMKRQALASGELESKKMVLEAKKQIIENVFTEAKKRLDSLDEKKREALIKKLLEKSKRELEIEHVYCSRKDAKFIKGVNVEPADILGGIIGENNDKTIRIDYSFETMLEIIKESELQSINKILFG